MHEVTSIIKLKEERPFAWNVIFTADQHEMHFATDIVYAARRNMWIANSFITHDLSSLLSMSVCPYCVEEKIACSVLCHHHEEVMTSMIKNSDFQNRIRNELPTLMNKNFPLTLIIETKKDVWEEVLYENFTSKLLMKKNN
ncbi:hypothetical protein [Salipaludibacillus daqingensis]|uniref:hypothetical protein n=1 Tax=Salipaludibacillus daqingensis TaxID=3041001 RepID=UPI0024745337|nr:hypothetical protein [Salipaludibacillus daqingensis]